MSEWKDLDESTPLDVLMNMIKYDIQLKSYDDLWVNTELDNGWDLFDKIMNGDLKYRYRLKPLKSIRITQQMVTSLMDDYFLHIPVNKTREEFIEMISKENEGRKVEIID